MSGLAPRWGHRGFSKRPRCLDLGRLRPPARGKSAHYKLCRYPQFDLWDAGYSCTATPLRYGAGAAPRLLSMRSLYQSTKFTTPNS